MDDLSSLNSVLDESQTEQTQAEPIAESAAQAVETQAEPQAEPVEQTGEKTEVETPPVETPEEKRRKGLEATLLAERRKRQEYEAELAKYRQAQPQKLAEPQAPQREQFASDEQYMHALGRYAAEQRFAELAKEQETQAAQRAQQAEADRMAKIASDRVAAGQAKYKDFDQVINSGLAPFLTAELHEELLSSPIAEELAYHLGTNPLEAARFSELSSKALAREVARLEARLEAKLSQPVAEKPKPSIPQTLTQARDARGRFDAPQAEQTPLSSILGR